MMKLTDATMKKKIVKIDHLANHWNIILTAISTVIVIIGVITTSYLIQFETHLKSNAAVPTPIPTWDCHSGDWVCPEYPGHASNCANAATRQLFSDTWCDPQCQWLWEDAGGTNGCGGEQSTPKSNSCPNPPKSCGVTVPTSTPRPYPTKTPVPPTATSVPPPTSTSAPTPTNIYLSPTSTYYYPSATPTRTAVGGPEPTYTPTPTYKTYVSATSQPVPSTTSSLPSSTPKPTITMASLPSITPIPTITPFPTTPPAPTATPVPPIGPLGCQVEPIEVHGNPSDKYDILFLSQGFTDLEDFKRTAEAAVSSVASSNLNSQESNYLYNKLNFWINAEVKTDYNVITSCIPGQANSVCWNFANAEIDTHLKCNADAYVILINSTGDGAMALIGKGAALTRKYVAGTVHELGHVMCILNDEYVGYSGIVNFILGIPNTNCSPVSSCPWPWPNHIGMDCIQGCTDGNWFRSSQDSIMNNWLSSKSFNRLSLNWCASTLYHFR